MKKDFRIVVDATADLDPAWLAVHGDQVKVIPIAVVDDGETRYDCVGQTPGSYRSKLLNEIIDEGFTTVDSFYDRLIAQRAHKKIVRSTFAQAAAYAMFEELFEDGIPFIYIGMTSALSGAYEHSSNILLHDLAPNYPDVRVQAIDSRCIAPGYRLLIERLMMQDVGFDDVIKFIEQERESIVHLFTINDFEQALAGGRVKPTEAIVGNLLSVRPCMRFDYRHVPTLKKELFTSAKARGDKNLNRKFIQEIKARIATEDQRREDPSKGIIVVSHAQAPERAERFAEQLRAEMPPDIKILGGRVGPAVGSHVGETTLAIFFTAKEPSTQNEPTWQEYIGR